MLERKEQLPNTLFAFLYKIRFDETEFPHPAKRRLSVRPSFVADTSQMKHPTTSRWTFAKTSQWYVSAASYWNVVTTYQEDVTTTSHQYVFTTSQISLK